jgi:AcrR family transcriptional regulator
MTASTAERSRAAAAATPRPKRTPRDQATRSREARAKLLDATIQVLLEKGYNGLTTKEVASRAGLSNGALMHHYANKGDLVVAATAEVYEECIARGQRTARSPQALENPIAGFMADSMAVYFEWPFIAALEVLMVARTDPALMERIKPVMEHYRRETNTLWLQVFAQAGYAPEQAELALNLTLNQVRGLGVHSLWKPARAAQEALLEEWLVAAARLFPLPRKARRRAAAAEVS